MNISEHNQKYTTRTTSKDLHYFFCCTPLNINGWFTSKSPKLENPKVSWDHPKPPSIWVSKIWIFQGVTPPKFNMTSPPEKWLGLEDDPASYWVLVTFQGWFLLNFGRVVISKSPIFHSLLLHPIAARIPQALDSVRDSLRGRVRNIAVWQHGRILETFGIGWENTHFQREMDIILGQNHVLFLL